MSPARPAHRSRPVPFAGAGAKQPGPIDTVADMSDADVTQILDVLAANGHRITGPRRILATAMLSMPDHFTPIELADAVSADHPEIAESTIYRFLDTLTELDIVEHGHLAHGPAVYHVQPVPDHVHLVCSDCETIIEVPAADFRAHTKGLLDRYGFAARPRHFALEGRCRACQAADQRTPTPD